MIDSLLYIFRDKMRSTTEQVTALRALMNSLPSGGSIDAYIIPSDDAHQVNNFILF